MPSNVNLSPTVLPTPQPTVGTVPRVSITAPDYGSVLTSIVKGAAAIKNKIDEDDEAESAKRILGTAAEKADPNFSNAASDDAADNAARVVSDETGIPVDDQQKKALKYAAHTGSRINDAIAADPGSERRLNIIRARELYRLIDKHPEMAKEFRSMLYGDNNFITSLLDQTDKMSAKQASDRHEIIKKAQDTAYQAGYVEVIDMNDEDFVNWYQSSGYAKDLNDLSQAKQSADYFKAVHEKGEAITAENTDRLVAQSKPGLVRNSMSSLDQIINDQRLDEAAKMRGIEAYVVRRRGELAVQMPWLSATEIDNRFSDILKTIPDTYRLLSGTGPEKQAAENRLAVFKATADLRAEQMYGISTVVRVSQALESLKQAGVLSNLDILKDRKDYQNIVPIRDFMKAVMANDFGDNPSAGITVTKRTEQQIADEQEQNNRFVKAMLSGYDKLDASSRAATAQMVVNAINHPDNKRTPAGMDRLMVLMASPQFKTLAESSEFKTRVEGQADRAIGNYLSQLDKDVGGALSPIAGHVSLGRDGQGVMTLVVDNTVEPKMRDAAARLQNRLRNAILANANLNGQTPAEASDDFVRTYLAE